MNLPDIQFERHALIQALENTDICMFWYYPQQKRVVASDKTVSLYHCKKYYENVPESLAKDFVHPGERQAFLDMYKRIEQGASVAKSSFSSIDHKAWCTVTLTPVKYDNQNHPLIVCGIVQNISDTHIINSREHINIAYISDILNALNNVYTFNYFLDLKSQTFQEVIGTGSVSSLLGKKGNAKQALQIYSQTKIVPEDREKYRQFVNIDTLAERLKDKPYISAEYRCLDLGWLRGNFITIDKDENNIPLHVSFVVENIDQQKQKESAYLEKISAFASIYFGTWEINIPNDTISAILEPEFARSISETKQATKALEIILNDYIEDEFQEEMRPFLTMDNIRQALQKQAEINKEYRGIHMGWCRLNFLPIHRDKNGDVTIMLMSSQNISEQKQKENNYNQFLKKALEETRLANQIKTDFLSKMSHDMRTPLNGILGLFEIEELEPNNLEKIQENRKLAKEAAKNLLSLINDVLEMSKLESDTVEVYEEAFDLKEVLERICQDLSIHIKDKQLQIHHEFSEIQYRYLLGSLRHIEQILKNICKNAVIYNKKNGEMTIHVTQSNTKDDECMCTIEVSDTGIGMPEMFISQIFSPFTQANIKSARTNYSGIGLGMAIAKKLIDMIGGSISIKSTENVGTTVTVQLPLKINNQISPQAKSLSLSDISNMHILIAEDNELNTQIVKRFLQNAGATITCVNNGSALLKTFTSEAPHTFDLILMDIMMPEMDGLTATRKLRQLNFPDAQTIPIIALSANAYSDDIRKSKLAGMDNHLSKPIDREKLLLMIASYNHR